MQTLSQFSRTACQHKDATRSDHAVFHAKTAIGLGAAALSLLAGAAQAQTTYTLTGSDPSGTSSFSTPLRFTPPGWTSGAAPAAGSFYEVAGAYRLRTPQDTGNYTFQGDKLQIDTPAVLFIKSTGGATLTIPNLVMNGGAVDYSDVFGTAITTTVAGNITLNADSDFLSEGLETLVFSAPIGGTGSLHIGNSGTYGSNNINGTNTKISFTSANTYSGGTTISNGTLTAAADGALGGGNVSVGSNGVLTLTGGTTNNYIADTASLLLTASSVVNLSFTGTDIIGSLSFDNGTTFAPAGTYGAVGSGALFTSSDFAGNGILTVASIAAAPEPSQWATLLVGVLGLGRLVLKARRRQALGC